MTYAIWVHRRGKDSFIDMEMSGPKRDARWEARVSAEHVFPDCKLKWSADAIVAMRDGTYQGCVSVEIAEKDSGT